jgi:large subunit ribosomal protein L2
MKAKVLTIEYDPNRTTNISLIQYEDKEYSYILHPKGLKIGQTVIASAKAPIKPGSALPLVKIPLGVEIHNIELIPNQGGKFARGAGSACLIIGKDQQYAHLKLPSGEIRKVSLDCYATIGKLDNEDRKTQVIGKAGTQRHRGFKPKVRGVAMHPGAHPHGGGEGRSGEGMNPKTPWGKSSQGLTRKKNKASNKLIIKRRK